MNLDQNDNLPLTLFSNSYFGNLVSNLMTDKIEHISVKEMWSNYLKQIGEDISSTKKQYTYWHFHNNENSANKLAELVLNGKKRATSSSYWVYEHDRESIPKEGDYSIIINWNEEARCIIRTTKVHVIYFNMITEDLAKKEGEGDLSLDYWKRVHKQFFENECKDMGKVFSDDMPVVFEEFEMVYK